MTDAEQRRLLDECQRVFRPSEPVDSKDLFAGRKRQATLVGHAINTRGRHAVIFGERGVGKTSLANILRDMLVGERGVVQVTCAHDDTFSGLWHRALSDVEVQQKSAGFGIRASERVEVTPAAEYLVESASVGDVVQLFRKGLNAGGTVFIFDEFDRLTGEAQRQFADTIKGFSDNAVRATLVLVGVARNVEELIAEHGSIDRGLVQIPMPRMKVPELTEIVNKAMKALRMKMDPKGLELVVLLSQGLPHYTHLLGSESTITTLSRKRRRIRMADVQEGIEQAIESSQHTVRSAYVRATQSPRADSRFQSVLLAAALSPVDELGFFNTTGMREPLEQITGKPQHIGLFISVLDKFAGTGPRGGILEKSGTRRRWNFRFVNPLMQPFVIMKGLAEGRLEGNLLELLRHRHLAGTPAVSSLG